MATMRTTSTRALLLAGALLVGSGAVAIAHETGAIHVAKTVVIGGDLALTGEHLPKNATLQLELRGVLDNYPVGQVHTDTAGLVQARLTLPPHVPTGSYTLVAKTPDGDVTARTLLDIVASAPAAPMAGMPGMGDMARQMSGPHATAEMMALERRTSPGEWAVIGAFIIATLVAGLALLRTAARLAAGEATLPTTQAVTGSPVHSH